MRLDWALYGKVSDKGFMLSRRVGSWHPTPPPPAPQGLANLHSRAPSDSVGQSGRDRVADLLSRLPLANCHVLGGLRFRPLLRWGGVARNLNEHARSISLDLGRNRHQCVHLKVTKQQVFATSHSQLILKIPRSLFFHKLPREITQNKVVCL